MMTEEAHKIAHYILYGEPLTYLDLMFRPGFIRIMLIVWSPLILALFILYVINKLENIYEVIEEDNYTENII